MTITTISSRALNQNVSRAKKASLQGPVFITDRGRLAHVLLRIEDYQKLTQQGRSIADALAMPQTDGMAFEPTRAFIQTRAVDLS
jgi:PHD/YefM family antitoxin component YafN of YafNO toxin-antitoxin module